MRIRRRWRRRIRVITAIAALLLILAPIAFVLTRNTTELAEVADSSPTSSPDTDIADTDIADTAPPAIKVPSMVSAISSDGASMAVEFEATALDDRDGQVRPICLPASNSLFAVGATVVTCIATDRAGNIGVARLEVVVADASAAAPPTDDEQVLGVTLVRGSGASDTTALLIAIAFIGAGLVSLAIGQRNRRTLARELARRTSESPA